MNNIKTYNAIAQEGLSILENKNYKMNETDTPDAIMLRSQDLHKETLNPELLAIARAGAGTNNVPVKECTEKGIVVFNTPGANANAVKELILASLLLTVRPILKSINWLKELESDDLEKEAEKHKKQFAGKELEGKVLGVIGLGAIGSMVANDAYRLGMNVIGYDPYVSVETAWNISRRVQRATSLDYVLSQSDFITIHVPLMEATQNMISSQALTIMKNSATLLNFSRKELVDIDALVQALENKELKSYVSDFADKRLISRDDCMTLPHLGASTEEAEINCAISAANTLSRYLETGDIINSVNFPNVEMSLGSPLRFTLIHKNVPNMLGKISTVAAFNEINIENMINKSRNDIAYTMIDVEHIEEAQRDEIIEAFLEIPQMVKVRCIENQNL